MPKHRTAKAHMPSIKKTPDKDPVRLTNFTVSLATGLLDFLLASMPGKSRTSVKELLSRKRILVNGAHTSQFDHPLQPGDRVSIGPDQGTTPVHAARKKTASGTVKLSGIRILFEDDDLIVIDKPSGLLSMASETEKDRTAYSILTDHVRQWNERNRVFILHRLDRETSGVMVFARNQATQDKLQADWNANVSERRYAAVVEGLVEAESGTAISWLKENKAKVMYSVAECPDGQRAVTHWRVLRRSNGYTLVELDLETGRKNQIRVHMKDMGHPVAGDAKYGAKSDPLRRLGLHARSLAFRHPVSGQTVRYESPVPPVFTNVLGESND